MGYINLMIRVLIGQCARAWNLQLSPPLKSRGVGGIPELQAKPFFIWVGPAHMLFSPGTTWSYVNHFLIENKLFFS